MSIVNFSNIDQSSILFSIIVDYLNCKIDSGVRFGYDLNGEGVSTDKLNVQLLVNGEEVPVEAIMELIDAYIASKACYLVEAKFEDGVLKELEEITRKGHELREAVEDYTNKLLRITSGGE